MSRMIDTRQFKIMLVSHAKELLREPGVLFWGIVFPLLMALGLGIAFTQSKNVEIKVAVTQTGENLEQFLNEKTKQLSVKGDGTENQLTIHDEKLGKTTYKFLRTTWKDAIVLIKRGEVNLILDEKNGTIQYNFDPANPQGELTYLNLSRIINTGKPVSISSDKHQVPENIQLLSLKGTRYIDFLVPGLLSMGVMMSSVWGLGYNLIEKRSKRLLRRMVATPMRKSHFLISFTIVRMTLSFIEASLLFLFSRVVFGVTIQGSIPALILVFIAANFTFGGIAILSSARTANTEIGNGIINAVTTPMIVLSGIFFSYHNFPGWAESFIKLLPLTILADSVRSIFIEGSGLQENIFPFIILTIAGVIFFAVGLKYFKWH